MKASWIAVVVSFAVVSAASASEEARQWRTVELSFAAAEAHGEPLDVRLVAVFEGPEGQRWSIPGFYDGDRTWRVRFMPPAAGTWSYRTECRPPDPGLHGKEGRLRVGPASGDNPLYRHGGILKVSPNRRYLTYSDGTPFFWLGDTWWFCPSDLVPIDRSNRPEIASMYKTLIDTRASQGFSVVQMAFLGTIQTDQGPGQYGDLFARRVNPAYWRQIDRYLAYANEKGLVPVIGCGFHQSLNGPTLEELQELWRYLLARYGSHAVTFLICGEYNQRGQDPAQDEARVEKILRLGRFIKEHDPYRRAMTVHPWAQSVERRQAWTEAWYDFILLQGGHGREAPPVEVYRQARAHEPTRPVIEGECKYEGIFGFTPAEIRHVAYRALQSGCCGYTYGSHGLWYPTQDEHDRRFDNWGEPIPWWEAYQRPGAAALKHLRACYESLAWWELEPRADAVQTDEKLGQQKRILAQAAGETTFLLYFPAGTEKVAARLTGLSATPARYAAQWFDPRTGKRTAIEALPLQHGQIALPARPSAEDWLLVLQRTE